MNRTFLNMIKKFLCLFFFCIAFHYSSTVMEQLHERTGITNSKSSCFFRLNSNSCEISREWGFEKLVFRNSITGIRRDRKYAIRAKNAFATGVHMSENVVGKALHKTETKIRYYHYHDSINILGEPCREFVPMPAKGNLTWFEKIPYVYDDNMKRIADTIKRFEQQTIGAIQV